MNSRLGPVSELTARGRFSGRAEPRLQPRLIAGRDHLVALSSPPVPLSDVLTPCPPLRDAERGDDGRRKHNGGTLADSPLRREPRQAMTSGSPRFPGREW